MTGQAPRDFPIIFSAPMVRAQLRGEKTMTRRILSLHNCEFGSISAGKLSKLYSQHAAWNRACTDRGFPDESGNYCSGYLHVPCHDSDIVGSQCAVCQDHGWERTVHRLRPKVQVGDRLWVRESAHIDGREINYMADHVGDPAGLGWRPSIHMPRWASRLTDIITAVKIERLQDISEQDAKAEGAVKAVYSEESCRWYEHNSGTYVCGFAGLWCHLHGSDSWDENPFVVAITFRVVKANIDAPEATAP